MSERNLSNDESLEMNVAISRKNMKLAAAQETETNLKPANSLCKAYKAKISSLYLRELSKPTNNCNIELF